MKVTNIRPFRIAVPQVMIDDLGARLAATRWPEKETVDDWDQGVPLAYAQELAAYWRDRHDWRRVEARLNALPNFLATVDGLDIIFLHIPSANPAAQHLTLPPGRQDARAEGKRGRHTCRTRGSPIDKKK